LGIERGRGREGEERTRKREREEARRQPAKVATPAFVGGQKDEACPFLPSATPLLPSPTLVT
jgi:hypothetical protein